MMELAKKRGFKIALRIAALAGVSAGLSGCYSDFGLGYASDGYGQYDCDPYSQFDSYYNCDYGYGFNNIGYGGGWYDNFYYPGYGIFLFDNYGRRYNMRDDYRRYWGGQRFNWQREHYRGNQYQGGQYGGGRQGGGYYPQQPRRDHDSDRDRDHHWQGNRNGGGNGWQGGGRPQAAAPAPAQPQYRPEPRRDGGNWQGTNGGAGSTPPQPRQGGERRGDGEGRRNHGGWHGGDRDGHESGFVAPQQRNFGGQGRGGGAVAPQPVVQPRMEAPAAQVQSYQPPVQSPQPQPRERPARKERFDGGADISADPA